VCICVRMFLVAFVTLRYPDDRLCVRFMNQVLRCKESLLW
jgi:hypothetical protein